MYKCTHTHTRTCTHTHTHTLVCGAYYGCVLVFFIMSVCVCLSTWRQTRIEKPEILIKKMLLIVILLIQLLILLQQIVKTRVTAVSQHAKLTFGLMCHHTWSFSPASNNRILQETLMNLSHTWVRSARATQSPRLGLINSCSALHYFVSAAHLLLTNMPPKSHEICKRY